MAITTQDLLVAAYPGQVAHFYKALLSVAAAGNYASFWASPGNPPAGTFVLGAANGAIPTDAIVGAVPITNAAASKQLYAARFDLQHLATTGLIILYDRLWHAGAFTPSALATVTLTAPPAITRDATGADVELWIEMATAMGATATTITATYTDQDGTAGNVSQSSGSLSGAGNARMFPLGLAGADTGVRNVTAYTVGGATGTGTFNIVALRRIAALSVPLANTGAARVLDFFDLAGQKIYDDSCLALMGITTGTSIGPLLAETAIIQG